MNFQGGIPLIPCGNFKGYFKLVSDLTSIQDVTKNCHYPEVVREPLRLQRNFTFPLEHFTDLFVLGEQVLQSTSLVLLEKVSKKDNFSLEQKIKRILLIKYRYHGSFPFDYVPTLDTATFAIINLQPSNKQGKHCKMISKSRQILNFADSLGRKRYTFLKRQCDQRMPEPLPSYPSVCCFYTIYAAVHLSKIPTRKNYRR